MIYNNVLEAIGYTPIIRLNRMNDPDAAEVLERIMPDYLAGTLYSATCNSFLSEVASRRSAMDSATKNAGEMINDLRLKFNRARQGAITQEITEIVAGAEQ